MKLRFYLLTSHLLLLTAFLHLCTPAIVNAQWEPDVRLTFNDSSSWTSPNNARCIAADGAFLHVAWFDYREGGDKVYYKRSTDGGLSWGTDLRLTEVPSASITPIVSIAASSNTLVHVVWCDYIRGSDDEIYYRRSLDSGVTWLPDTQLTQDDFRVEADSWPSIAAWGAFLHLVWHDFKWDGMRYNWDVFYLRSTDNGAGWGSLVRLTTDPAGSGPPAVAVWDSLVHVVWYDQRDGNEEVYYKRSTDRGATWGADVRLSTDPSPSYLPTVAASGTLVHVSWFDQRDGNYEIYYKRSTDSGTTWSSDRRLTDDPGESLRPSLAAGGSGVHVAWIDDRSGNQEILYKRSLDGGSAWGADTSLTSESAASFNPHLAVSGAGVHVVWTDERDGNSEIYYKRNPTGNSGIEVSQPLRLTPYTTRLTALPNPFVSYTTLPGHEAECFVLYDVSGRKVGTFKGDRVGEGLSSGVYFLKPEGKVAKTLRIIKLR